MSAGQPQRRSRAIYLGGAIGLAVAGVAVAVIAMGATKHSKPSRGDVASTRAYLTAREELAQANINDLGKTQMAMNTYVAAVSLPCRGLLDALSGAGPIVDKPGGVRYSLTRARTNEALLATASGLTIAAQRAQVRAITRFADAVGSLRWSNEKVSRLVQSYARSEELSASLEAPPVCRNLSSWVARGFSGTPESNTPAAAKSESVREQLGEKIRAAGYSPVHPGQAVLQLLAPYEDPSERMTSVRIIELERKIDRAGLEAATQAMAKIEHALRVPARGGGDAAKTPKSFRSLAVAKIVACLHRAGVEIPRSDPALLSSTSGIKTRDPRVKVAIGKCRSESLTTASR